jgi:O-antigen ligase
MQFNIENVNINGFIIILLSVNALVRLIVVKNFKPLSNKLFAVFVLFYLVHLIGVLYSENKQEAVLVIERKLSLIAFPVILFSTPQLSMAQFRKVLLSFVVCNLIVGLVCLGVAIIKYSTSADANELFYHVLSVNIGMHAAYLSLYFCFSLAILLYVYYSDVGSFTVFQKIAYWFAVIFFTIIIIMLSSRTQMLLMMMSITIYLIYRTHWNKSVFKLVSGSALIVIILFGLILLFPKTRERLKEAINYNNEYALNKKWGEKQMRYLIWASTIELIKEKPIIGYGTGDVQDELTRTYTKNEYVSLLYFSQTRFNAHNQFLETAVGLGAIGLLVFLLGIGLACKFAVRNKNHLYLIFIGFFVVSCITESMLERQNGVVFFAFFNSFLLLHSIRKQDPIEHANTSL